MQAQLAAPPEYVVSLSRPFLRDQIIDLACGQAMAKVNAAILQTLRAASTSQARLP